MNFFYKAIPEYRKVKRLNVVKYLLFKTLWKINDRYLAEIISEVLSRPDLFAQFDVLD